MYVYIYIFVCISTYIYIYTYIYVYIYMHNAAGKLWVTHPRAWGPGLPWLACIYSGPWPLVSPRHVQAIPGDPWACLGIPGRSLQIKGGILWDPGGDGWDPGDLLDIQGIPGQF